MGVSDEVVDAELVVVGAGLMVAVTELVKEGIVTSAWALASTVGDWATNTAAPIAVVIDTQRATRAAVVPTNGNATT